jgi:hypothetical protein
MRSVRSKFRYVAAALLCGLAALVLASPAGASQGNSMTVTARDFSYAVKGKLAPGYADITVKNDGREDHVMAIAKVKKSATKKQVLAGLESNGQGSAAKVFVGDPERGYGTPDVVGAGQQTEVITNQLDAGNYAMFCYVSSSDGKPHFDKGMISLFAVSGKKTTTKAPKADADVTLTDSAITVPPGPAPEKGTVKVTNTGSAPHSFVLIKLESGKTLTDAHNYFVQKLNTGTAPGAAPGTLVGGVSSMQPGTSSYLVLDLKPGHYGYVSTEGQPPNDDASKGLAGEFDVQ